MGDKSRYKKTLRYLKRKKYQNIDNYMKVIDRLLEVPNSKQRYSMLYDLICEYLDREFCDKNICSFENDICIRRRYMIKKGIKKSTYANGCCYSYKDDETCQYYSNQKCTIKNIACKLYTCFYLRKKGYKFRLNDIYFARYFLNPWQKWYIKTTFFKPKEKVLSGIVKRRLLS